MVFGNPQGRTDGKAEQGTKLGKEVTRKIDVFLFLLQKCLRRCVESEILCKNKLKVSFYLSGFWFGFFFSIIIYSKKVIKQAR